MKRWIARRLYPIARDCLVWCQMDAARDFAVLAPWYAGWRKDAKSFLQRAVACAETDLRAYMLNLKSETQLIDARLARRYDPSAALNEAFERAARKVEEGTLSQEAIVPSGDPVIDAHYAGMQQSPPQLTNNQQTALAVQQQYLRRNLGE